MIAVFLSLLASNPAAAGAAETPPVDRTAPPAPVSAADWARYKPIQEERNRRMNAGDPLGAFALSHPRSLRVATCSAAAKAFHDAAERHPPAREEARAFSEWVETQKAGSPAPTAQEEREALNLLNVLSMTGMGLSKDEIGAAVSDNELMALFLGAIAKRCRTLVDEPPMLLDR